MQAVPQAARPAAAITAITVETTVSLESWVNLHSVSLEAVQILNLKFMILMPIPSPILNHKIRNLNPLQRYQM